MGVLRQRSTAHDWPDLGPWPGGGAVDHPAFYSYAYPEADGFRHADVGPRSAFFSDDLSEFVPDLRTIRLDLGVSCHSALAGVVRRRSRQRATHPRVGHPRQRSAGCPRMRLPMQREFLRRTVVLVAVACVWLACSTGGLEALREHTYPPSFNYVSEEQLQSAMWKLADQAIRLDRMMRTANVGDEALQAQVIWLLTEMVFVTGELGPADWPSNHPRVSRNVAVFRRDLEAARRAVEVDPPNYFLAGFISGACVHCHEAE